jgi:heme exporter protein A
LARAIASNTPLCLLDEPTNALDSAGVERLAEAIAAHRSAGGAVVAASHLALPGDWRRLELSE